MIAADVDKAFAVVPEAKWFHPVGEAMSHGGTPDRIGVAQGRGLAVEIKRPGETPTRRQLVELRRWQTAGALVGWVCSVADFEALLVHLHDREWTNPLTGPGDPSVGDTHAGSHDRSDGAVAPGGP